MTNDDQLKNAWARLQHGREPDRFRRAALSLYARMRGKLQRKHTRLTIAELIRMFEQSTEYGLHNEEI